MTEIQQVEMKKPRGLKCSLVILSVALVLSAFIGFQSYTNQQNQILALNRQRYDLQQQLESLQLEYDDYKTTHSHSNNEFDSLDFAYDNYLANHHHTDSEYEEIQFYFYYDKPEQKFGVYDLRDEIAGLTWKKPYQEGVFDCSEMSASLERYLENKGWHTIIVAGNSPFGSGYHAWLLVETTSGKYMPVESTTFRVVWWEDPNFNNYFKYDHEFETIQDALAWSETEFDWWK
jgi:type II secretory pathway pseudopilin PulG